MKTLNTLFFVALGATILFISCDQNKTKPETPATIATEQNDSALSGNNADLAAFLVSLSSRSLSEIKLSDIAQQRTQDPVVKQLAIDLMDAHKQIISDISAMAEQKNIVIPQDQSYANSTDYTNLNAAKPAVFDDQYIDIMIQHQSSTLTYLDSTSTHYKDADVKKYIQSILPSLRANLDAATQIQQKRTKASVK